MKTLLLLLGLALSCSVASATSIIPPDFATLVNTSDRVLRGVVTDITATWLQPRVVQTHVTVTDKDGKTTTLDFLGGKIGDFEMRVEASPKFTVGEEVLLFVKGNHTDMCPIVGWGHGTFRIRTGADGVKRVHRENMEPVESTAQVKQPLEHAAAAVAAKENVGMSVEDFEKSITQTRAAK